MKKKHEKHRLLIHCRLPQIREGFEVHLDSLDFPVKTHYADLSQDGIVSKLKFVPHLIIVLLNESDSDMALPLKLKMFAAEIPVLWITPAIPQRYESLLKTIGVESVITLPCHSDSICNAIRELLQTPDGFP